MLKWLPVICPAAASIIASVATSFAFQEKWTTANIEREKGLKVAIANYIYTVKKHLSKTIDKYIKPGEREKSRFLRVCQAKRSFRKENNGLVKRERLFIATKRRF